MLFYPSSLDVNLEISVSWSKDSEFLSRSTVVVQTGERRCAGWACLSKHRGLQFAETLGDAGPFLLCAETTKRVVCQKQCCFSLSCKSRGVGLGSTRLRRHKPDLPSYPLPKRKGCLLSVIWLMCILSTYNNTHRVNPLSVTCCCLM